MNHIEKTQQPPDILQTIGKKKTLEMCSEADKGTTDFEFDSRIYADKSVKNLLIKDQHNKCAYCERYLNGDFGDVEHFRPKKGYMQNSKLMKPGYYWLAYDWSNLLCSCSECNRLYKKNNFPIADESKRNIAHRDISKEQALLVNPVEDDVSKIIEFNRYIITTKNLSDADCTASKAQRTIELLKLNERGDLLRRRRQVWEDYVRYETIRKIALHDKNTSIVALCDKSIEKLTSEESEFTGMFKYQYRSVR